MLDTTSDRISSHWKRAEIEFLLLRSTNRFEMRRGISLRCQHWSNIRKENKVNNGYFLSSLVERKGQRTDGKVRLISVWIKWNRRNDLQHRHQFEWTGKSFRRGSTLVLGSMFIWRRLMKVDFPSLIMMPRAVWRISAEWTARWEIVTLLDYHQR